MLVCAIGGLVLLAWYIPLPQLIDLLPGLAGLSPSGAAGILAAGVALFCFTFRPLRLVARLIGLLLVIVGLAILLGQDLFGFDLGGSR